MKQLFLFEFPKEESGHAITYDLIKEFDLKINIIRASIDFNARGFLLVEIEGNEESVKKGIDFAKAKAVEVSVVDSAIRVNEEKCVHCGACSAVCVVDALYLDTKAMLVFDKDKCIDCKLCVKACPARAIEAVL
jgi:ferredoxin